MENASEIGIEELAKTLELWDKMTSTYEELSIRLLQEGYRKQSQRPIKGGYFGTHCHICHEAVNDCRCVRQSPESSRIVSPQGVPCIHEWAWSNNSGRYHCNKCQHWSYLGKEEVGTQQSKMVPITKSKIYDLLDKYKFAQGYVEFVEELCSTVGTPTVPSVEEIETEINNYSDRLAISDMKELANAIHRLLTNGKEGK